MNFPWFLGSRDLTAGITQASQFLAGAQPSVPYAELVKEKSEEEQTKPEMQTGMAPAEHLQTIIPPVLQFVQRRNARYARATRGELLRQGAQDLLSRMHDTGDALDLAFTT